VISPAEMRQLDRAERDFLFSRGPFESVAALRAVRMLGSNPMSLVPIDLETRPRVSFETGRASYGAPNWQSPMLRAVAAMEARMWAAIEAMMPDTARGADLDKLAGLTLDSLRRAGVHEIQLHDEVITSGPNWIGHVLAFLCDDVVDDFARPLRKFRDRFAEYVSATRVYEDAVEEQKHPPDVVTELLRQANDARDELEDGDLIPREPPVYSGPVPFVYDRRFHAPTKDVRSVPWCSFTPTSARRAAKELERALQIALAPFIGRKVTPAMRVEMEAECRRTLRRLPLLADSRVQVDESGGVQVTVRPTVHVLGGRDLQPRLPGRARGAGRPRVPPGLRSVGPRGRAVPRRLDRVEAVGGRAPLRRAREARG